MKSVVEVRDIKLGEGIPKIAVPLMGRNDEELMSDIKYLKTINFDLVEWRIDYYKDVENIEKIEEVLSKIRRMLGKIPLLVTFRTAKEGGEKEITLEYYVELNKAIVATKNVDLIDVELFIGNSKVVKEIVDIVHENGVKVIMSNHDFHKTPSKQEIVSRLCKMQQLGADIPKIAVMPSTPDDVLELLSATNEMRRDHDQTPVITMSMGSLGVISRLAGETFGSALTFGSVKAASAPGQLQANELDKLLRIITSTK
ncbi:type I 3-dehydroquinate dehydratase [Clostridium coskatii]|uniref:3-dehydroquinate dehydratase n=1 Tax=Clostridium coskatii TaxID=1705578 RepID=A0A166TI45_9CLOT|nr:type I 3-dehydroquinate dehydratase [Clostridium coskatii]OAA93717.1 3-dehydroquinate dehydratase [Clostridium coskatii]OBR96007.1 3-dehydroquinate dehydratase [Clostridium coskatii]